MQRWLSALSLFTSQCDPSSTLQQNSRAATATPLASLQVKCGVLKTNKPLTLYDHPNSSYVTCMAARRNGNAVVAGHADGSLHHFQFDSDAGPAGSGPFAQHSCCPSTVAWGSEAVLVTGSDCKVSCGLFLQCKCMMLTYKTI